MNELPFLKIYTADWLADTRILTANARALLMDLNCMLWRAEQIGILHTTIKGLCRITGLTKRAMTNAIEEINLMDGYSIQANPHNDLLAITSTFLQNQLDNLTVKTIKKSEKNATEEQKARSEKAAKAAKARWNKENQNEADENSNAQASNEHMLNDATSNAQAYAQPCSSNAQASSIEDRSEKVEVRNQKVEVRNQNPEIKKTKQQPPAKLEKKDPFAQDEPLAKLWSAALPNNRVRSSKKQVAAEWHKIKNKPNINELLTAIEAWKNGKKWTKENGEFAEGLHLWIKNQQWENVPEAPKKENLIGGHKPLSWTKIS